MDFLPLAAIAFTIVILAATRLRLARLGCTAHVRDTRRMAARPPYYFVYTMLWCALPPLILLAIWSLYSPQFIARQVVHLLPSYTDAQRSDLMLDRLIAMASGDALVHESFAAAIAAYHALSRHYTTYAIAVIIAVAASLLFFSIRNIKPEFNARLRIESFLRATMWLSAAVSILTTMGIVLSVLFETIRFFGEVPVHEFLFGTTWSPQTALRADQAGSSGAFGAVPLLVGTLLISAIALLVATPVGLISAIYMTEFSSARMRAWIKPALEILAGIPTVVYGFFAALIVAPAIYDWGIAAGLQVSTENALAAGLVMGVMLIPFVSSLSDDVLNAVPRNLYEGSLAMGVSRLETVFKVMVPAALPGIVSSILLAASRAIGETMIVVMAAGLAANLTFNPLDSVTTVTVQIQALLVGDQEFDSAKTLSAFALGFTLLLITLVFNMAALHIIRKYRERYE